MGVTLNDLTRAGIQYAEMVCYACARTGTLIRWHDWYFHEKCAPNPERKRR